MIVHLNEKPPIKKVTATQKELLADGGSFAQFHFFFWLDNLHRRTFDFYSTWTFQRFISR